MKLICWNHTNVENLKWDCKLHGSQANAEANKITTRHLLSLMYASVKVNLKVYDNNKGNGVKYF